MEFQDNIRNGKILIAFYKGDIIGKFKRKPDGKDIAVIQFPKTSKYAGYVWYWPLDRICSNDTAKNDQARSFNPDKRWIRANREYDFICLKRVKDTDTSKWRQVDEVSLNASELKDRMKRPFKKNKA